MSERLSQSVDCLARASVVHHDKNNDEDNNDKIISAWILPTFNVGIFQDFKRQNIWELLTYSHFYAAKMLGIEDPLIRSLLKCLF